MTRRALLDALEEARRTGQPIPAAVGRKLFAPKPVSEHVEQSRLFAHLRALEAQYPILRDVYAVPNAEQSKAQAGKKWAEGMRRGPPDINLDVPVEPHHGLRIEFKRPGTAHRPSALSTEQREWIARLRSRGYLVAVTDNWAVAFNLIVTYLGLPQTLRQPIT